MACFVVPAAEAIVVTAAYLAAKKKEQKIEAPKLAEEGKFSNEGSNKITWSKRLSWLLSLLWGGVLLLAFEHIWHGEVILYPPFLSAMQSAEDTATMLHEMATVGVSMAVFVTAVWGVVCAGVELKLRKKSKAANKEAANQ